MLLLLGLSLPAVAQKGNYLHVERQHNVSAPGILDNLSLLDGRLTAHCAGAMLTASIRDGVLMPLRPDVQLMTIDPDMDYAVRNPRDSMIYYTVTKDNNTYLYVHLKDKPNRNQRVRPRKWNGSIVHPVFSKGGDYMFFASADKGFGGYDLWASWWNGSEWGAPFNMGRYINTTGNESYPAVYGDYLIFASDGVSGHEGGYALYATRVRYGLGLESMMTDPYAVQRLPYPINGDGSDSALAVDVSGTSGYWLSRRDGEAECMSFDGDLMGIRLWGNVRDGDGQPLAGAVVSLLAEGRPVAVDTTTVTGEYSLLAQPDVTYLLVAEKSGYYHYELTVTGHRDANDHLIRECRNNIAMEGLPINQPIYFNDAFPQGTDENLTPEGEASLAQLLDFVRDNRNLKTIFTLACDPTTDTAFNSLVTDNRINSLQRFVESQLPPSSRIIYQNATNLSQNTANGTGNTQFMVLLSNIF